MKTGLDLIAEIDQTLTATPTLWWLGRAGFVIRFANVTFYIDPCLSGADALLKGEDIRHADMILATHGHPGHMDASAIAPMLENSKTAKLILPKSAADDAHARGIAYPRMTTTDADLRVEYFKGNLYGRVYAVPSAHPQLDWTPVGGFPYLGYLIRFGRWTIYHAGDCARYETLASRLKPYTPAVVLLPIGGKNFSVAEAAQLAEDVGARWVVPMHYGDGVEQDFVTHMLGHRPQQQFKVFARGEKWTVPED